MTLPASVTTLALAEAGDTVTVRAILFGAGEASAMLRAGDQLTCRGATNEWLVLADRAGHELPVHRRDAALVQIDRCGIGVG
jgi:hypothetical protein